MTLESVLEKARYLALALPLFALVSTAYGGCSSGSTGYGRYGSSGSSGSDEHCTTYAGYSGYRGGSYTYTSCDDDGYVGR